MRLNPDHVQRELQTVLAAGLPGAAGPEPWTVTDVNQISDGWEADVWSFATRDAAGGQSEFILRLYQGQGAAAKAALEFATLERLRAAAYPVPQVYLLDERAGRFGQPFIIMERIAGPTISQTYDAAAAPRQQEVATQFIHLLASLHQLDWRPFAANPAQWDADDPSTRVRRTVEQFRDLFASIGCAELAAPVLDWLDVHSRDVACERPAMTHGDFHGGNVLLRADGSAAVIDWTLPGVRDPRFDLAWMLLLSAPDPASDLHRLLLSTYESMTGAPVRDLAYFEACAVGRRLLSYVIVLLHGGERLGLRPGLEEPLRRHTEYLRSLAGRFQELTGVTLPEVEPLLRSSQTQTG